MTKIPSRSPSCSTLRGAIKYDMVKVEEALLALRGVFQFENGRVWKRYDFAMKDTLHDTHHRTSRPAGVGLPD